MYIHACTHLGTRTYTCMSNSTFVYTVYVENTAQSVMYMYSNTFIIYHKCEHDGETVVNLVSRLNENYSQTDRHTNHAP